MLFFGPNESKRKTNKENKRITKDDDDDDDENTTCAIVFLGRWCLIDSAWKLMNFICILHFNADFAKMRPECASLLYMYRICIRYTDNCHLRYAILWQLLIVANKTAKNKNTLFRFKDTHEQSLNKPLDDIIWHFQSFISHCWESQINCKIVGAYFAEHQEIWCNDLANNTKIHYKHRVWQTIVWVCVCQCDCVCMHVILICFSSIADWTGNNFAIFNFHQPVICLTKNDKLKKKTKKK